VVRPSLSVKDQKLIPILVDKYQKSRKLVRLFQESLVQAIHASDMLQANIHSVKSRLKDPTHLAEKIQRIMLRAKSSGEAHNLAEETLLTRVHDLAGIRLLHLHTQQIRAIDLGLREIFDELKCALVEKPFARTWDDESRAFFADCGFQTQESPSLYTSVHYVVGSVSRTQVTCEIQVRTLAEELWGEIDHALNYPAPTGSVACREQLRALARVTSGATRLVDSIMKSHDDYLAAGRTGSLSTRPKKSKST
jgi:putative GTP pyrophosphokinase